MYIINFVFGILCNVGVLIFGVIFNFVVCWGGYLINEVEY